MNPPDLLRLSSTQAVANQASNNNNHSNIKLGMAPTLRQSRTGRREDFDFEPIGNQDSEYNHPDQNIKQDVTSEDGFYPGDASEENRRRKNSIGAYRNSEGGLPAEKGYPIQIGSELFRLSGASIMSDAPSYFSRFFEEQIRNSKNGGNNIRTLYIDRDPETFRDIARHLQGYHIHLKDGQHYVRLFADAQFYSLARLNKLLFSSDMYIQIGEQDFKIPRDIFSSPGDSPNFFSLGFAMFFNQPEEAFPGLDHEGLIRPPPIEAPRIQGRSASTFADLLQLLRGYPLDIRNSQHRAELLRDCRYYNLKGLEQKVVYHDISFNLERQSYEILMRIEDLRQSGISIQLDAIPTPSTPVLPAAWVKYARPYADDTAYDLIVEIDDGSTKLDLVSMRAEFFNHVKARITSLFQVIANKISLADGVLAPLHFDTNSVQIALESDAHIILDGKDFLAESLPAPGQDIDGETSSSHQQQPNSKKRKHNDSDEETGSEWIVTKGQWRIRVLSITPSSPSGSPTMKVVLHAVKLDAVSGQRARNQARSFLVS